VAALPEAPSGNLYSEHGSSVNRFTPELCTRKHNSRRSHLGRTPPGRGSSGGLRSPSAGCKAAGLDRCGGTGDRRLASKHTGQNPRLEWVMEPLWQTLRARHLQSDTSWPAWLDPHVGSSPPVTHRSLAHAYPCRKHAYAVRGTMHMQWSLGNDEHVGAASSAKNNRRPGKPAPDAGHRRRRHVSMRGVPGIGRQRRPAVLSRSGPMARATCRVHAVRTATSERSVRLSAQVP